MSALIDAFRHELRAQQRNDFSDNHDFRRFGNETPKPQKLKDRLREKLVPFGFHALGSKKKRFWAALPNVEFLYERLPEPDQALLVKLLAYRLLGEKRVKLPLSTPDYWAHMKQLDSNVSQRDYVDTDDLLGGYYKVDLSDTGYPMAVWIRPAGINTIMEQQQYRCDTGDRVIEAEPGDVVIDAGGCSGDTALYFAHKTQPTGQTYSWEFMPGNLEWFERNLALNPGYAERVHLVENALWSTTGERLYIAGQGAGSYVTDKPPAGDASRRVDTLTIDDMVKNRDVGKVNFIKMDIEGAELEALKGGEQTIRQHRPKLAISVYHKLEDLWTIPQWIDALGMDYRFHLRHFTVHAEETVLFAD